MTEFNITNKKEDEEKDLTLDDLFAGDWFRFSLTEKICVVTDDGFVSFGFDTIPMQFDEEAYENRNHLSVKKIDKITIVEG